MLFSCLAHFAWWIEPVYPTGKMILADIGKVATPTFLLLSGAMTGWLCASPSRDPTATRYKILNRGLFLVTFGHLLVSLAEAHRDGGIWRTMQTASIVDEIGLCMLVCAALYPRLRLAAFRERALITGAALFAACWITVLAWHPASATEIFWRQVFLGPDPLGALLVSYNSPTLQYMAIFAMGLAGGGTLQAVKEEPLLGARIGRFLLTLGLTLASVAVALRVGRLAANYLHWIEDRPWLDLTTALTAKYPPSPAYLAFFGGTGMALAGGFFLISNSSPRPLRFLGSALAVVGRASLFVFVLQYFVYWTLPDLLGIVPGPRAPWVFVLDLVIIWVAAWGWGRVGGNRFLTVGLRPRARTASAPASPGTPTAWSDPSPSNILGRLALEDREQHVARSDDGDLRRRR